MGNVLILSADKQVTSQLCSLVSEEQFEAKVFRKFDELESALSRAQVQVAILDVDSVSIDNRKIKLLKKSNPHVNLFCASYRRIHPELQEAFSRYICACLNKPVDPDELQFWLRSIRNNELNSRAPP